MSNKEPEVKYEGVVDYGPNGNYQSDFAKDTPLDANSPVMGGKASIGGDYVPVPLKTASVTGPTGLVETTYNHENLSAKFKYPQVSQDTVPQDLVAKPGSSI